MKKKDENQLLIERIKQMEIERATEMVLLKDQFKLTSECLKPINLIKNAFTSTEAKNVVIDSAIGFTSGLVAKKAVVRSSNSSIIKLLGSIVQMGVTNLVSKNPEIIKSIGSSIFKKFIGNKNAKEEIK